ncbi:MAG: energy transducer TonB [Desulfobulbaceae bacterium]|nr:energy transducer TonB [Desulfobulbaceae bacterium]
MIFPDKPSPQPKADEEQWRLPLILAIGLHLLGFLLILFPPTFLFPHRDLTEVQTINLFDAGDLMQPAASGPKRSANALTKKASPPEPKKEAEPPKPEPKKEEVKEEPPPPPQPPEPEPPPPEQPKPEPPPPPEKVVPVEPPPKPVPVPEKAISLEPRKVKKKITPEKPEPEKAKPEKTEKDKPPKPQAKADDKILKSLERIKARVKEKQENQALKDKLSKLRDSLHEIAAEKQTGTEPAGEPAPGVGGADAGGVAASGMGGGSSSMLDEALKRYYIAISRKIHSNWALPDTQDWDNNLEAIAVIVIKRDGTVVDTFFEKKSDNIYFDQYVEKTIQAALPMPPIPSDIQEDELEIGLKFRPSGLF